MTRPSKLQVFLQRAFARVGADYVRRLQLVHTPDLQAWVPVLADQVLPLFTTLWKRGARRSLISIMAQLASHGMKPRQKGMRIVCKREGGPRVEFDWALFNRHIEQAAREAVFAFCRSTLDTISGDVNEALAELHEQHLAGLATGETLQQMTARVQSIFGDPDRAFTIATTETQRAVHTGQLIAAKESGIVSKKRWLASSDACDKCLALAAMGEIPLDEPFTVNPKGGPYAVVQSPPLHPRCMCSLIEVVDYELVERGSSPLPGLAIRARLQEMGEVL